MPAKCPSSATRCTTSSRCGTDARTDPGQGPRRRAARSQGRALAARRGAAAGAGRARRRDALSADPRPASHVRHRLEPELHERLHHGLPVLRVLSEARPSGSVDADHRPGAREDRACRVEGRHDRSPSGRPQPGAPPRLLRHDRPRDPPALSAGHAALLHRIRDPGGREGQRPRLHRRARPPLRRGPAHAPRRRRGGALRARAQAHRAQEGRAPGRGSRCIAKRIGAASGRRRR